MKNQNTVDLRKLNKEDKKSTDILMALIMGINCSGWNNRICI